MAVIDVIDVFLGSLERRKGGGGHGGGSSKSGGGGKKSGGSSSSGSSSGGSSSKGGGSSSGSGSGSSSSGNKAVGGSSSSNYFPSSHPKVSNAQAFGFGAGVGIGSNHHASSYSNGNLNRGTLGSDSPYAGREYGGANRVSCPLCFCEISLLMGGNSRTWFMVLLTTAVVIRTVPVATMSITDLFPTGSGRCRFTITTTANMTAYVYLASANVRLDS
jgi:hypothetical protein